MDYNKSSVLDDASIPWRTIVVWGAVAQTLAEYYINNRQLLLLHSSAKRAGQDVSRKGLLEVHYNSFHAFYRFLQILFIVNFDAIPELWFWTSRVQAEYFPKQLYDSDWGRSYLFLLACWLGWGVTLIPNVLFQVFIVREGFKGWWRRGRHDPNMAFSRLVQLIVIQCASGALQYKLLEKRLDVSLIGWCLLLQTFYAILIPVCIQPRGKHLTSMEEGETRKALTELAETAKFPLKDIYVMDKAHPIDGLENSVQAWGLFRKTYITVHEEALEMYNTSDLTALLAQELGAWKRCNGMRMFGMAQLLFTQTVCLVAQFVQRRSMYESFGFSEQYPLVAGIILFAVGIAPPLSALYNLKLNFMLHSNQRYADAFAADLGYSHALASALVKVEGEKVDFDWIYSGYYNVAESPSERIAALQIGCGVEDSEKQGAIRL